MKRTALLTLILAAAAPLSAQINADIDSGGWGSSQARLYAVSTLTSSAGVAHLLYAGIITSDAQRVTLSAQCPGPDPYLCLPARMGSCIKSTWQRSGTYRDGSTWTETVISCVDPAAGECVNVSGPFGPGPRGDTYSLVAEWMIPAAGCPF